MAGELFGSPIGRSMAEQDMAKLAMSSAQTSHLGVQDAMAPFSAQQRSAQARWLNARSEGVERDVEIEKKIATMMQAEEPATVEEKDNPGWRMADIAMRAGSPKKAMEYAGKASTIDQHVASANTQESRKAFLDSRKQLSDNTAFASEVRGVDSPEALQAAIQRHARRTGDTGGLLDAQGLLVPGAAEQWEKVKENIQQAALTENQRITAAYKERALASADRIRNARIKALEFAQDLDAQEELSKRRRKGALGKVGTDILNKTEGANLGTNFIKSQFVSLPGGDAQAKIMGRQLAEQAAQMRATNPALTPTEAIQNAFDDMEKKEQFIGLTKQPAGADANKPIPLMSNTVPKKGQYYGDKKDTRKFLGVGDPAADRNGFGPNLRRAKLKNAGGSGQISSVGSASDEEERLAAETDQIALAEPDDEED